MGTEIDTSAKRSNPRLPVQFPEEIIMEILSKLPVKVLLRFRSVSKSWLVLICSPEFVKAHFHSSLNNKEYCHHRVMLGFPYNLKHCSLRSLLYSPITETSDIYVHEEDPRSGYCVGSANGLICLAIREKSNPSIRFSRKSGSGVNLCIWNPSIRKLKKLPQSGVASPIDCSDYFSYGFGYDELHEDYKVLVIFNMVYGRSSFETTVKIYSLKTHSWRTVEDFQGGTVIACSGKFVGGKIYWTSIGRAHENNGREIISFDLADETWGKVEQPNYRKGKFNLMLGVLGNDLVVLCDYEKSHYDLWVLKDDGVQVSWTKMFTISCPHDPRSSLSFTPPFSKSSKGDVLLSSRSHFMIYNPKDYSIIQREVTGTTYCIEPEIYVESLVNPLVC